MILTEHQGCAFNDKIDINLCPSDIKTIENLLAKEALGATNYVAQGNYRRIKDVFNQRHNDWNDERKKYPTRKTP